MTLNEVGHFFSTQVHPFCGDLPLKARCSRFLARTLESLGRRLVGLLALSIRAAEGPAVSAARPCSRT